jgi:hypothetical protein
VTNRRIFILANPKWVKGNYKRLTSSEFPLVGTNGRGDKSPFLLFRKRDVLKERAVPTNGLAKSHYEVIVSISRDVKTKIILADLFYDTFLHAFVVNTFSKLKGGLVKFTIFLQGPLSIPD